MTSAQDQWSAVDRYLVDSFIAPDAALDAALRDSQAAGLPNINVSPTQGKLLQMLVRIHRARRILEIGTLGGYSTIWMAQALPADGKLITLEYEKKHADVAKANIERAGLGKIVDIRLGKAVDSLPRVAVEGIAPFDLIFIDADKPGNPDYFAWAMKLARPGSVIVIDNVIRSGKVIDAASQDGGILGTRKVIDMMKADRRITSTAIQTVGSKGYDGFAIAVVNEI